MSRTTENPEQLIGKLVEKKSGKPFKSKLKANTVKAVVDHPYVIGKAFIFEEDNTFVSVNYCRLSRKNNEF